MHSGEEHPVGVLEIGLVGVICGGGATRTWSGRRVGTSPWANDGTPWKYRIRKTPYGGTPICPINRSHIRRTRIENQTLAASRRSFFTIYRQWPPPIQKRGENQKNGNGNEPMRQEPRRGGGGWRHRRDASRRCGRGRGRCSGAGPSPGSAPAGDHSAGNLGEGWEAGSGSEVEKAIQSTLGAHGQGRWAMGPPVRLFL